MSVSGFIVQSRSHQMTYSTGGSVGFSLVIEEECGAGKRNELEVACGACW